MVLRLKGLLKVTDVMEGAKRTQRDMMKNVAEEGAKYKAMTPAQMAKKVAQLEVKMYQHSRDLEFEEAAKVRDEVNRLQNHMVLEG